MRSLRAELRSWALTPPDPALISYSRRERTRWIVVTVLWLGVFIWGLHRARNGGTTLLRDLAFAMWTLYIAVEAFRKDRISKASWWRFLIAMLVMLALGMTIGTTGVRF